MTDEVKKIQAVYDSDLGKVISDLGLYSQVTDGSIKCHFCNTVITMQNLQIIYSREGQIRIVCDKTECEMLYKQSIKND